jgi:hypothetical protein
MGGINKLPPFLLLIPVAAVFLACNGNNALAAVITLNDKAKPKITIQVGSPGNQIDTVTFTVPNTTPGDGTPITGSNNITINLAIRATAANPLTAFLTVDSATPLNNGHGNTIPAAKISWTTSDGEIPSGTFAGTSNQLLATYTSSVRVRDRLTFFFANDTVYDAGTYNGQVTYTWFVP